MVNATAREPQVLAVFEVSFPSTPPQMIAPTIAATHPAPAASTAFSAVMFFGERDASIHDTAGAPSKVNQNIVQSLLRSSGFSGDVEFMPRSLSRPPNASMAIAEAGD